MRKIYCKIEDEKHKDYGKFTGMYDPEEVRSELLEIVYSKNLYEDIVEEIKRLLED
jgi:hypothetical protein